MNRIESRLLSLTLVFVLGGFVSPSVFSQSPTFDPSTIPFFKNAAVTLTVHRPPDAPLAELLTGVIFLEEESLGGNYSDFYVRDEGNAIVHFALEEPYGINFFIPRNERSATIPFTVFATVVTDISFGVRVGLDSGTYFDSSVSLSAVAACASECITHEIIDSTTGRIVRRDDNVLPTRTHQSLLKVKLSIAKLVSFQGDQHVTISFGKDDDTAHRGAGYTIFKKNGTKAVYGDIQRVLRRDVSRWVFRVKTRKAVGTFTARVTYHLSTGDSSVVDVPFEVAEAGGKRTEITDDVSATILQLHQNYPNPFNPTTTLTYNVPEAAHVTLRVYDVMGRVVQELVNDTQATGTYQASFDGSQLSSGTYFAKMVAGDVVQTRRLLLVK